MPRSVLLILILAIAAAPASAQTPSQGSGFLQAPSKTQAPAAPQVTPSTDPPAPAPRAAVQQVAPMVSPSLLGHPPSAKAPPVVQAPTNVHAQKPPPAKTPPVAKPAPPAPVAVARPAEPPPAAKPVEPSKGSVTGQPLPRFAALRSDDVNLRSGPGFQYPIEWQYRRRDLPVEIEREYDTWRLITDQDGVKGWVHAATLIGRRNAVVKGKERILRKSAADDAGPVAILKPGVVVRLRGCEAGKAWCDIQVGDYRGWIRRDEIWGVYPNEVVN